MLDGAVVTGDVETISWSAARSPGSTAGLSSFGPPVAADAIAPTIPGNSIGEPADFVIGPENRLLRHSVEWLRAQSQPLYSPLVLCGMSGTGKSHLARAIADSHPNAVYTHGAEFACEFAAALDRDEVVQFRARYRQADLVVLDDLLQLTGRRAALQEFALLLDALEVSQTPVVIMSSKPPQEAAELPAALRSRLSGGLIVTISPPGVAARQELLQRTATARRMTLSITAAQLLAEELNVTAGELRGAITELSVPADGQKSDAVDATAPTAIDVQEVRQYLVNRRDKYRPTLTQVSTLVAKYYGLKPSALSSPSRRRQTVLARSVAIYLGRTLCGASLKSIGQHFGGRDHSTVLHNYHQVNNRLNDDELKTTIQTLRQMLLGNLHLTVEK
jgi:chromosomal replication initiator protein